MFNDFVQIVLSDMEAVSHLLQFKQCVILCVSLHKCALVPVR